MSDENQYFHVSLKLILKNNNGEVLLLKMPDKSRTMAGFYDFPGGRIQEKETYDNFGEIMKRETIEEIGDEVKFIIDFKPVSIGRHNFFSEKFQKQVDVMMIFFEAKYLGGEIKISPEHGQYDWVKMEDIDLDKYFVRGMLEGMKNYLNKVEICN